MRILLLSRYDRLGASSRIRSHQYIPSLQAAGLEITVAPLFGSEYLDRLYAEQSVSWPQVLRDYFLRGLRIFKAKRFNLLWIEKELFPGLPAWFEQALTTAGIPYVVDYDDAVFHRYDMSKNPLKRLLATKIDKIMQGAAVVICGNGYLAERARRAGAPSIEILPSVVDLERYELAVPRTRERTVVGWIGSPSTAPYLQLVVPSLRALSKEREIELRVIGAEFVSPDLHVDCRPWSEESEVDEVQDIDIGLMPLFDSPWEAGKCGYKLIQYMACGVPSVASPVGMNCEIVVNGVNGFFASTAQDWTNTIRKLSADRHLREALGAQGRLTVEQHYSLQVTRTRLARILMDAARRTIS
jgi:glycosyltransferase involved in cell wall biosynthesis